MVLLPLIFVTSIFAMNNIEFPSWPVQRELIYVRTYIEIELEINFQPPDLEAMEYHYQHD